MWDLTKKDVPEIINGLLWTILMIIVLLWK
jgi:hypothetical protein